MDLESLMKGLGPIQESIKHMEEERREAVLEGSAGGGAVKILLGGDLTCRGLTIAPAAAAAVDGDAAMLEDLIRAALEDALRAWRERFGATPQEQIQKGMGDSPMLNMLGPLLGL